MRRDRRAVLAEMGLVPMWRLRDRSHSPVYDLPAADGLAAPVVPPTHVEARVAPADPRDEAPAFPPAELPQVPVPAGADDAREDDIGRLSWDELRDAVARCTACGLHAARTQTVFGVGDAQADWLLVGEAPGAEEDRLGEPFVGQAGRLLDNMLAALALKRGENVYIANVLKCRPPGNRNPNPEEVARCSPYLLRQVALIRPKLILAMGRFAVQSLLQSDASIASLRGKVHRYAGVPLVVTYHPAYLLRNLEHKARAWSDLVFARRVIGGGPGA